MEKVKAFVIKYQLWFKLAAIALLVSTIFAPFVYAPIEEVMNSYSFWVYIELSFILSPNLPQGLHWILSWIILFVTIAIIVLFIVTIIRKTSTKILYFGLYLYIIDFILILISTIWACIYERMPNSISCPHIAFYIALLLLVADIITLWQLHKWTKNHPRKPTKNERIAELEKRIEELENRKDGYSTVLSVYT